MSTTFPTLRLATTLSLLLTSAALLAQEGPPPFGPPGGGPGGPGGFGGRPGGPGGPGGQQEQKLVKKFDKDGDQRLNAAERAEARDYVSKQETNRPRRGPGGPGGPGGGQDGQSGPVKAGPKMTPADVPVHQGAGLYEPTVLRTLFLTFENEDWEKELNAFYNTDVEVPAKLLVDGQTYPDVGVHFRGASSFFTVSEGRKRSLNLSLDYVHDAQRLGGYRTLNLLNSHTDPTFLRSALYLHIANQYLPAPRANFARVVINGESWGVFVNAQQFNSDFTQERFGSSKGARWKVPGRPQGGGGLVYRGDDPASYKGVYDLRTKEDPEAWKALIQLCKVISDTPPAEMRKALEPLLDIEGALRFLALENALINNDGYWIRASDFNLYREPNGKFHLVPHDANETMRTPEGPGWRGGVVGVELDPFFAAQDSGKPLLSKLLAVPEFRTRYLTIIRDIAENWLDWSKIEPLAKKYQAMIANDVKSDTHRLYSVQAFEDGVVKDVEEQGFRGPRQSISLKSFVEKRRAYLLAYPAIKELPPGKL